MWQAGSNVLASGTEMVSRLVKSRSGHQGRLTHINNQISTLLYDSNNVTIVRELPKEMFERQWKRFSLVHGDILIYVANDTLAMTNAKATFNEQASRRRKLLNKINNYLSNEAMSNKQIQSIPTKAKA